MQEIKHLQSHKKVKFTPEEDAKLNDLVQKYGENDWSTVAFFMNGRNKRQCRERWRHYLSPQVSTEPFTEEEDKMLHYMYLEYGHKWKLIASFFPNRTDITVKNRCLFLHRQFERHLKGKTNQSMPTIPQASSFNNFNQINCNIKLGMNYNLGYSSYQKFPNQISSSISQYNMLYSLPTTQSPISPAPAPIPVPAIKHKSSDNSAGDSIDTWAEKISNLQWDDFDGSLISSSNRDPPILFS
ncbi:hypothetical protein M9Y10_023529 [Tritrichomonas musculus]|uniref:Myb-like DNA-binding domain containing protein n=1 Tax=Tritrichomonas musculus TaxID=1915356 RepID=A0ABR2KVE0_9EUKA